VIIVGSREATSIFFELLIELLADQKGGKWDFTKEKRGIIIEELENDDYFFDKMVDTLEDYLDSFGENFGLWE